MTSKSTCSRKQDELHYLKQVFKYLKHLEHLYHTEVIKDNNKLQQINVSINNTKQQIEYVERDILLLQQDIIANNNVL